MSKRFQIEKSIFFEKLFLEIESMKNIHYEIIQTNNMRYNVT